jgi:PAS domain S-box-containing protein
VIAAAIDYKPFQHVLRDGGILACDLLEALPAAIYLTDAAGHLTFYNQAAADLWGWRPDLGGAKWCGSWRLFWPDGTPLPHDQCPMALALQQNRQVRGAEAQAEHPDGTRVPFAPYPTPLRDANGELLGGVNLLVDISEVRGGDAVRHRRPHARLLRRETERRASNLLMAILPIAGIMQEYPAVPHRRPSASARALALRLMDESGLGDGSPRPRGMRSPATGSAGRLHVWQRPG